MKSLRNNVQLIGKLGADPKSGQSNAGKQWARLSLATNEKYKNKNGETIEETYWHNLVAWGKTAEIITNYLKKGSEIAIEGKLTNRSWEDTDGQKRYATEVVINEFLFLDKKVAAEA